MHCSKNEVDGAENRDSVCLNAHLRAEKGAETTIIKCFRVSSRRLLHLLAVSLIMDLLLSLPFLCTHHK